MSGVTRLQKNQRRRKRRKSKKRKKQLYWLFIHMGFIVLLLGAIVGSAVAAGLEARNKMNQKNEIFKEPETEHIEAEVLQEYKNWEMDMTEEIEEKDRWLPETQEAAKESDSEVEETEQPVEETDEEYVLRKLDSMTLEEKVAQMFMITPEALTGYGTVTQAGDVTRQALEEYPVGGIIFFENNVVNPEQLTQMTANLQSYSKERMDLPLFIGIDEEGGKVSRIAKNANFPVPTVPYMSEIGASLDYNRAYEAGKTIGQYLKQYGCNINFAPDADVITNPENTVVAERSFGSDPQVVANMALQYIAGLEENQVLSCMKHFPGHGATTGDTHAGYSYTMDTLEEMEDELYPFQQGISQDISFIMVSHIAAPNVTGDEVPASLSKILITDILRNQLGYDGIIITDAMNMNAIVQQYGSGEAAVKSILAGSDILLMPKDFKTAYQSVILSVQQGTITEERINDSVKRILMIKNKKL